MSQAAPRAWTTGAAFVAAALGLGGCNGFTPLYAASGVSAKLSAIEVARPDGRTGFLLGESLDDEFAKNREQPAVYRLTLRTREIRIPRGITVNNVATRYEVQLGAAYVLTDIATQKVVTTGKAQVNVSYDVTSQPYAALSAEEDGEVRAAQQAAQRIRIDLAGFFAAPSPAQQAASLDSTTAQTYSERLQPATVLSPRERALGQPTAQSTQTDILGNPLQSTVTDPAQQPQPFSPSQDPNGVKTLPLEGDSQ